MNQIEPYFSEKELCDAINCVAMCITESIKKQDTTADQWKEYLLRWNSNMYYPQEVIEHMYKAISVSINSLNRE